MASKHRQHVLADHVCELVEALTKHRRGSGPHWFMVSEIEAAAALLAWFALRLWQVLA